MQTQLQQAIAATREAGALTLQYFGGPLKVAYKDRNDPLTEADLQADAYLKEALRDLRPDCGWLSEETVDDRQRLNKEAVWIVDPIDGTREFVEGIPEYVIAVALVEGGEPTLAVIYNPVQEKVFAAVSGSGTFRNGQRVFCSEVQSLSPSHGRRQPQRDQTRRDRPLSLAPRRNPPRRQCRLQAGLSRWRGAATSTLVSKTKTSGMFALATCWCARPAASCTHATIKCGPITKPIPLSRVDSPRATRRWWRIFSA